MAIAGAVRYSVVALLVARDDPVAANALALRNRVHEPAETQRVVRCASVPFRLEQIDRVPAAIGKAQRGRLGGVQRDTSIARLVKAAEVDHELAIDERPNVVVPRKVEYRRHRASRRGRRVCEEVVKLAAEREVVPSLVVAVDARLRVGARVPSEPIDREEREGAERVHARRSLPRQGQRGRVARGVEIDQLVKGVGRPCAAAPRLVIPPAEVGGAGEHHGRA